MTAETTHFIPYRSGWVKVAEGVPGVGFFLSLRTGSQLMRINQVAQDWHITLTNNASTAPESDVKNSREHLSEINTQLAHHYVAHTVRNLLTVAIPVTIVALGVVSGPVGITLIGAAVIFGLFVLIDGVRAAHYYSKAREFSKLARLSREWVDAGPGGIPQGTVYKEIDEACERDRQRKQHDRCAAAGLA